MLRSLAGAQGAFTSRGAKPKGLNLMLLGDKLKENIQIYLMAQGHRVEDFSQVNAMLRFKGNCKSTTSNQVEKQSEMIVA
jgi:hypothetical protein